MREEIYRFLSPPERGTSRYRATTAAKEISDWLLITLDILLIAKGCGPFNPSPSSAGNWLILALPVVFLARYAIRPTVWFLKKLAGIGKKGAEQLIATARWPSNE